MNMLIKAAEVECRGPPTRSGLRHPPIRAYMDDMTITTTSVNGARWLLKGIENFITWVRMSFNATNRRSLVLKKKCKLSEDRFKLSGEYIPTIMDKLVKTLEKRFNHTLKDTVADKETRDSLETLLNKIDRSGLLGRFKAWVYQHVVLQKMLWPLVIYEFASYNVKKQEKRINSRLRRWLGLPKCLSRATLYGNSNTLKLPFKRLVEKYKVAKVRTIQLKFSNDLKMSGAEVYRGKKWKAAKELRIAEERLREKEILGVVASSCAGLVFPPLLESIRLKVKRKISYGKAKYAKEKRKKE